LTTDAARDCRLLPQKVQCRGRAMREDAQKVRRQK